MDGHVLFRKNRISTRPSFILGSKLHHPAGIVQFPDPEIQIQKKVIIGEITQEQASVTIPKKSTIVSKLDIQELGRIEHDAAAGIQIILGCFLESLIEANTWDSLVLIHPLPDEQRSPLLIFCEVCLKGELPGHDATGNGPPCVQERHLISLVVVNVIELKDGIDGEKKIGPVHLDHVRRCPEKCIPHRLLTAID